MAFLAPLFFAALAALGIPVLIHLIQRERKNVVQFPSLMFVRRIPYSSIRRRRIHNWALLLLRLAALVLIIAAFARPFLRSTSLAAAAGGARDAIILLDRSYSMGHGDQWDRAKQAAIDAVAKLADGDRGTLVLFDASAEIAVQPTNDKGRLRSEVTAATLSAGATRFGPALKLAGSLLAGSNHAAARGDPHQRFSAQRMVARRRPAPADGHRAHPRQRASRHRQEPRGDAGDDSARQRVRTGSRHGHRRRAQPQRRCRDRSADLARARRPRRAEREGQRAAERLGVHDLPAVDAELTQYARRRPHWRRCTGARQRVLLRAVAAAAGCGDAGWRAPVPRATRCCISRARWPLATTRASRSAPAPSTI